MKLRIIFIVQLISITINAQTGEDREIIKKSYDLNMLNAIKRNSEIKYLEQQSKINSYLLSNPEKKRQFNKNGNFYFLHHISDDGIPVYINTKDTQQILNAKTHQLYQGGSLGINITGTGMIAGVWDGGQVSNTHELLQGKVQMQNAQTLTDIAGDFHMSAVSGILVGRDLSSGNFSTLAAGAKGIAYDATTKNYDWDNDISEMVNFASDGYLISNHSYGYDNLTTVPTWVFGAYDATSREWDELLKQTPYYLPFVAVGNEQSDPESGNLADGGFDMITGSSAAKNVLTVGSIDTNNSMTSYSNWGPTDDGRVKPDLVTLGSNVNTADSSSANNDYTGNIDDSSGTSYASPVAAATALLLQQYYHSIFGSYMKASSLKALMLHTADDSGNAGPDAKFGWGILNAAKAAETIRQMQPGGSAKLIESVTNPLNNDSDFLSVNGISGQQALRVSVCWTDDQGTEQTSSDVADNTNSRLVYRFGASLKVQPAGVGSVTKYPFKPLSILNPQAVAVEGSGIWDNHVDNYQQINAAGIADADVTVNVYKHSSSPSTLKPYSLLITGLKATNASLATSEIKRKEKIVFYDSKEGAVKMISNDINEVFGDYKILDISGRIIQSGKENSKQIVAKNLSKGVYIVLYGNFKQVFKFKL
nr:S8 family serine peptidase [uncultured Chryseobacterium sp.]